MKPIQSLISFLTPKMRPIMQFLAAQGVTLAGNVLYGLLCVRLLPPPDYAKFVVLFAVQGTIVILMDVNFSTSLIPLVGEQTDDAQLIADYVASLRQLTYWLYAAIGVGLAVVYPLLVKNRGWSWQVVAEMVATLLLSTWFMRIGSTYGYVLILMRDRKHWYRGQMISSLGTLALLGIFWALHILSGFSAILINVSGLVFIGVYYFYRSRTLMGVTGVASVEKKNAIFRLALPNIPQSIFYALQGQIPMFLITYFGHTTGVASVGALARLGQMFALISPMNGMLIEPFFAKIPKSRLRSNYILTLFVVLVACASITLVAFWYPEIFLWVLGPKYDTLRFEVMLSIFSSAIGYLSSVLFCIHNARRFIYWWANISTIVVIFAVQAAFVFEASMSTVRDVLYLNIAANLVALLFNILSGVYGFVRGPRDADKNSTKVLHAVNEEAELVELESHKL